MGISHSTARLIAPASFVYDFAAQQYGIFSTPSMKDIHDMNLAAFSSNDISLPSLSVNNQNSSKSSKGIMDILCLTSCSSSYRLISSLDFQKCITLILPVKAVERWLTVDVAPLLVGVPVADGVVANGVLDNGELVDGVLDCVELAGVVVRDGVLAAGNVIIELRVVIYQAVPFAVGTVTTESLSMPAVTMRGCHR